MKRTRPDSGTGKGTLGGLEHPVPDRIVGEAGDRLELAGEEFEGRRVLLPRRREADLAARATAQEAALDERSDLAAGGLAVEAGGGGDRADVAARGIARRERGGDAS